MKGFHVKITDALILLVTEVRYRLRLDFRIHVTASLFGWRCVFFPP
jgi:hypothetical protein